MPGIIGQYITPIPVFITVSMLASMVMSLTMVPIFRHWHESKRRTTKKGRQTDYLKPAGLIGKLFDRLILWYGGTLMPKILKKPLQTGIIGIVIGTAFCAMIPFTPVQLFPNDDRPQMVVDVTLPSGSSIVETTRVSKGIAEWIKQQLHIEDVFTFVGGEAPKMFSGLPVLGSSEDVGQLVVIYDNQNVMADSFVEPWIQQMKQRYPEASIAPHVLKLGPPTGSPVAIRIYGEDLKELYALSEQVKKVVSDTEGTYDVKDSLSNEQFTLQFNVNQSAADDKMVNESDLSRTLRLVSEGIPVGQFDNGKDLIDTQLQKCWRS